jgi:hypothetical protein
MSKWTVAFGNGSTIAGVLLSFGFTSGWTRVREKRGDRVDEVGMGWGGVLDIGSRDDRPINIQRCSESPQA